MDRKLILACCWHSIYCNNHHTVILMNTGSLCFVLNYVGWDDLTSQGNYKLWKHQPHLRHSLYIFFKVPGMVLSTHIFKNYLEGSPEVLGTKEPSDGSTPVTGLMSGLAAGADLLMNSLFPRRSVWSQGDAGQEGGDRRRSRGSQLLCSRGKGSCTFHYGKVWAEYKGRQEKKGKKLSEPEFCGPGIHSWGARPCHIFSMSSEDLFRVQRGVLQTHEEWTGHCAGSESYFPFYHSSWFADLVWGDRAQNWKGAQAFAAQDCSLFIIIILYWSIAD